MHYAINLGVPVRLLRHIDPYALAEGRVKQDMCVAEIWVRVDSNGAHYGVHTYESAIRNVIHLSANGFDLVDKYVECIWLSYLATYSTDRIIHFKGRAYPKIRDEIEILIPRVDLGNLKT